MAVDGSAFLSREELLGGLPARRASMLLFAIEGHTAHLVGHARQAMARLLPERTAAERLATRDDGLASSCGVTRMITGRGGAG